MGDHAQRVIYTAHTWERVGRALWHCPVCDCYAKGAKKPSAEAVPSEDARAQARMLGLTAPQEDGRG